MTPLLAEGRSIRLRFQLLSCLVVLLVIATSCRSVKTIQKPIPFSQERLDLSIEYMQQRHSLSVKQPFIQPQMVVVHWTAIPTLKASYRAFEGPLLPGSRTAIAGASALNVSSHYLIDRDGTIYQLMPDTLFARHTIGLNHCAIGIENVGDGRDFPLTEKQFRANVRLVKKLLDNYEIRYVIGHHEYQQFEGNVLWKEIDENYRTKKSDPGKAFMSRLRAKLRLEGTEN